MNSLYIACTALVLSIVSLCFFFDKTDAVATQQSCAEVKQYEFNSARAYCSYQIVNKRTGEKIYDEFVTRVSDIKTCRDFVKSDLQEANKLCV